MDDIRTKIKSKLRELGLVGTVSLVGRRLYGRLHSRLLSLLWYYYKLKYYQSDPSSRNSNKIRFDSYRNPEEFVRAILSESKGRSFLEIGIGESPNIERLRLVSENDIRYTGCDFAEVCDAHEAIIRENEDINYENIRFLRNRVGTYSWTLFELLKSGKQFDIIYLDGHHTFYIDCSAIMLAHLLLKPGGIFLLDDIRWTLKFMKNLLMSSFREWNFYRKMYDFSQYDNRQQSLPHVGMLAETILIDRLKYSKLDAYSTPDWWALKKPSLYSLLAILINVGTDVTGYCCYP